MRNLLTLVITLCLYTFTYAQSQQAVSVSGVIVDSVSTRSVAYVTLALIDAQTNQTVRSTISQDDGHFKFVNLKAKSYKLALVSVGYANKVISFNITGDHTDLGRLLITPSDRQLQAVAVTAVRPLMKKEIDGISYDVQADPESKTLNALDMLRRVPMVSVDAADNIKLKGATHFKILINGKSSALVAKSPADVLRAMPASNIQKIEVITTPPAKYDAEGLAGIINIITKQKLRQGYSGSVTGRYNNVNGIGPNLSLTLKEGKVGIGGYVGYNHAPTLTNSFNNYNNTFDVLYLSQNGVRTTSSDNLYTSSELSYEADSLNLFTASVEYFTGSSQLDNDLFFNLLRYNSATRQSYRSLNNSDNRNKGVGLGANYQLGFKHNKEQLLTFSYKYDYASSTQLNDVNYIEHLNYDVPNYRQYNKSGSGEHTAQVDYVQPFKKISFEAGAKAIFRKNYSDFNTNIQTDSIPPGSLINNFDYQQNIYSLYNSYQLKLQHWVARAGARFEHTRVSTNAQLQISPYSNLIPSLSIQRLFTNSSLTFGYTDRLQRPGILQLNPFLNGLNINFVSIGNPGLHAVVSHGLELTYSHYKKSSFNVGLNYRFANNTIESVTTAVAQTINATTYQNVGNNKALGLDVNVNYPVSSKLNVSVDAELQHIWLRGVYRNEIYNSRGYQGHTYANAGYKLSHGYRLGASIDYDSRYVMLQGRDNYYFAYAASGAKDFWDKMATLSISITNPFKNERKVDAYSRTRDFYQYTSFQNYARRLNVTFVYKFGKLKSGIKRNSHGIKNDDLNHGRGN
ncbi:TonB-dependent receptor [Mucilaginibacter sp. Bleaf8]|uniref:outer membrane beta-barrel family protein n=1 Tax=Mucilaginibacter sp. Bleaf8 TaxID=2834430 RepID=UPI001BCC1A2F|nr:outer membrane beta-barrel family protein [Mucilaginibacter sp. Bleaf8]MBS7564044.1 TonB-dependent receptor [Mucilaginibacter sp. Bleaf8]